MSWNTPRSKRSDQGRAAAVKVAKAQAQGTCQICGRTNTTLQADHIVPVSRGGTNNAGNLRMVCVPCHQRITKAQLAGWRRRASRQRRRKAITPHDLRFYS